MQFKLKWLTFLSTIKQLTVYLVEVYIAAFCFKYVSLKQCNTELSHAFKVYALKYLQYH